MKYGMITVAGPTAAGKTSLAVKIAQYYNGEVISADSRQVYRGMDIATGKDINEYTVNGNKIKYHLIDIADPSEEYNLYRFRHDFIDAYNKIKERNKLPVLCGGTGLYLDSVLSGYSMYEADFGKTEEKYSGYSTEELKQELLSSKHRLHNSTDLLYRNRILKAIAVAEADKTERKKIAADSFNFLVDPGREETKKRITARLKHRLQNGMIEEAETLLKSGVSHEKLMFLGLEFKYLSLYLRGELNYNDMYQKLNSAIHNFAKRQMTWFRKMERNGIIFHKLDSPDFNKAKDIIETGF